MVESIFWKTAQMFLTLTSNTRHRLCLLVVFLARTSYAAGSSRRFMQSGVLLARNGTFTASRANVDCFRVGSLPVAFGWGLVRQRQVCLVFVNFFALVCFIIYDRLVMLVHPAFKTRGEKCLPSWQKRPRSSNQNETPRSGDPEW